MNSPLNTSSWFDGYYTTLAASSLESSDGAQNIAVYSYSCEGTPSGSLVSLIGQFSLRPDSCCWQNPLPDHKTWRVQSSFQNYWLLQYFHINHQNWININQDNSHTNIICFHHHYLCVGTFISEVGTIYFHCNSLEQHWGQWNLGQKDDYYVTFIKENQ